MPDLHKLKKEQLSDVISRFYAYTPHNTNELPFTSRMIYVGGSSGADTDVYDIQILGANDTDPVIIRNLKVGVPYGFRVKKILVTSTTATNIIIGY
jgi:hypothetical protein